MTANKIKLTPAQKELLKAMKQRVCVVYNFGTQRAYCLWIGTNIRSVNKLIQLGLAFAQPRYEGGEREHCIILTELGKTIEL